MSPAIQEEIKNTKETECDFTKLSELCTKYPSFQPLFAQTIERINGSSSDIAPDLVDRLLGRERPLEMYPSLADKLGQDPFDKVLASLGTHTKTGEKVDI